MHEKFRGVHTSDSPQFAGPALAEMLRAPEPRLAAAPLAELQPAGNEELARWRSPLHLQVPVHQCSRQTC